MASRESKISHTIYSESTLRQVNQLALVADVACTSGAGIGQVVNLALIDPDKTADVIIVAGANEIRQTDDEQQYQYQVSKAAEKLHELSAKRDHVTLVLPPTPRESFADEIKFEVLKETMRDLKSMKVVEIPKGTRASTPPKMVRLL